MLPKIIKVGYKSIDLIHFFTCGPDEVRCWTGKIYKEIHFNY